MPGSDSIRRLFETLQDRFGEATFSRIEEPGDEIDSIGWRLANRPRYLFSVSTHAGEIPDDYYDLQVSIADDSFDNGEIILLENLELEEICDVVARVKSGETS